MGDESDLPRIVVEGDSIIVLEENDWVGRDVKGEEESEEEEDLDKEGKKGLDIENLVLHEDGLKGVLEEAVGGLGLESKEGMEGLYNASGRELYDNEHYNVKEEANPEADIRIMPAVNVDELEQIKNRTRMESAGFKDFEAEKRRKEREAERDVYGYR